MNRLTAAVGTVGAWLVLVGASLLLVTWAARIRWSKLASAAFARLEALAPRVAVRGSEGATGYDRHMGVTEWSDKQDKTLKCTRRRLYSHYCSHQRRFRAF